MSRFRTRLGLVVLALAPSTAAFAAPAEQGTITARDGVRLHYEKVGSGPQTVIVPAALFLARDFAQVAEGRTLIFYDMRNRGRSDAVQDPARLTIQEDVRDLETVRAHFRAKRFSAIGYSYLGMMVMLYDAAPRPHRGR